MSKIICIMGKSSTGKDTIYKTLLKTEELHLQKIVPYTTRPIRDGEKDGVQYYFTTEEDYKRIKKSGKIVEERLYHTFHGDWRYFTVDDGQFDNKNQDYMMIGTLEAYQKIRNYYGEENVIPILIEVDDIDRLQRALDREKGQDNPKLEEMCRRFLADSEDFSEEKIAACGIEGRFKNTDLDSCVNEIKTYLLERLK